MKFTIGNRLLLLLLLSITCCYYLGCTDDDNNTPTGPQDTSFVEYLQFMLEEVVDHYEVPGAVIAITFPSGETWIGATGLADIGAGAEVLPSTPFKIGSITKTFTATVVLQLVDEGYLDLDDSIHAYLPDEFNDLIPRSSVDSVLTIRRLLNHTSGLISYNHTDGFNQINYQDPQRMWTPIELVQFATDSLLFEPGTDYSYSNTGYILLGVMIEGLTGNSIKTEIENRIINKLALNHTWFRDVNEPPTGMAHGYIDIDGDTTLEASDDVTLASPTTAWAAGAMVSNAEDLLEWVDSMVDGELISAQSQAARMDDVDVSAHFGGQDVGFGLGIVREGEAWGHVGGIDGFSAIINKRNDGFKIVTLVNGQSPVDPGASVAHDLYWEAVGLLSDKGITEDITTYSTGLDDYNTGVGTPQNRVFAR